MLFNLYLNDLFFLQKILSNQLLLEKINQCLKNGDCSRKNKIELSDFEVEILLDELGGYFVEHGLNMNDEPNEIGLYVESLIDLFYNHC